MGAPGLGRMNRFSLNESKAEKEEFMKKGREGDVDKYGVRPW
jgi:hypothetical protein